MNTLMVKCGEMGVRRQGFTLIELLIAMVVIAILASVAFPSFMQSVRKGNRSDAESSLMRATGNQERFFATNGTYTTLITDLGFVEGGLSENEHYQIVTTAGPTGIGSSYVVTATAVTGHMQAKDTGCTVLSVDSLGQQLPDPADSDCW
jgi:type IV pilus assembly protein PilE